MFTNLTYKRKNLLLLLAAILFVFLIYTLAIKKTWLAYYVYNDAKEKIELAANAPIMAAKLEKELITMDAKIGNQNKNGTNTEQALIELLTTYSQNNNVVLREFPEATDADQGNIVIETNQFVIEGTFSKLINLVHLLEQKVKLGKVASAHYQLKKDIKTREMALTVTIFVQNIKKKQNEK